jgi:hypothetical protein
MWYRIVNIDKRGHGHDGGHDKTTDMTEIRQQVITNKVLVSPHDDRSGPSLWTC